MEESNNEKHQTSIFEMIYPTYKITKPIRLIELFAGYGSQALALKYLGVPFEHWKISEWAIKSIQAYKDIHFPNIPSKLEYYYTKEELVGILDQYGISNNYNEPMERKQIERMSKEQLETILANINITHNLVNIQQVSGKSLEIVDTDKFDYILTYSFPCQDLSLAGNRKLMNDTSTRSGLLWEVERILTECKELGEMPKILLMENVIQVHGEGAIEDFNRWQLRLEQLGYKNYWQDLIATDYGIPQTRNRCFMVSILGDYNYIFPKPIPLKLKLKDMLEENVNKKYFLSKKMVDFFLYNEQKQKEKGNGFTFNVSDGDVIAKTITTRSGSRMDDNFIGKVDREGGLFDIDNQRRQAGSIYNVNGLCPTLDTMQGGLRQPCIKIKNATKKGYLEASNGDGIDLAQPKSKTKRGRVQKNKSQTITCGGGNILGVVVDE